MASEIEEESDLIKIALLPDSIRDRVKEQISRIDQLIRSKDTGGGGAKQIKKIKLIPSPRRIKNLTEWNDFKKELDERISSELGPGDEVELS
jgi:hypothetical protein